MKKSAFIFLLASAWLLFAAFPHDSNDQSEYARAEGVGKICTEKLWLGAVKKTGKFPYAIFEDDTLCLTNEISLEGVDLTINILKNNRIKKIVISSVGGDAEAAMDLADEILDRKIDVYVEGPCFSACANYIFLAGDKKYILKDGIVAWHGAPMFQENLSEKLKLIAERHKKFFKRISVDAEITSRVPCSLREDPQIIQESKADARNRKSLWTYAVSTMKKNFNVQNVTALWQPRSTEEIRENDQFAGIYKNVLLGKSCDD